VPTVWFQCFLLVHPRDGSPATPSEPGDVSHDR
jgi:hypothetical protein